MRPISLFIIILLTCFNSFSQDSTSQKNNWNFLLEPYIMFPSLAGTAGVGTLPDAQLDADASDIFSNLKIGAILYFEATKDRWAFSSDLMYLKLGQDVVPGPAINKGDVNFKQLSWEVAGLRKLLPFLEAGIGLRLNSLNNEINLLTNNIGGGTTARNKSKTETWVDPVLIARIKGDANKKFIYQLRGDIGGFGVGSEFAWQIQAYAGYRFSKLFQLTGGYRIISVDYNKGTGDDRFLYDMDTFGPVIRFGFNF